MSEQGVVRRPVRPTDRGGPLRSSVTLGRVAGVEIGFNWTWLIIVALIVWSLGAAVFPDENPGLSGGAYAGMAFVAALLFFASLLLQQLGHAVVARREGMEIDGSPCGCSAVWPASEECSPPPAPSSESLSRVRWSAWPLGWS